MKVRTPIFLFYAIFSLGIASLHAQQSKLPKILLDVPVDSAHIQVDSIQVPIKLPHTFLIPASEQVYLRDFKLLRGIHYQIDYRAGTITVHRTFPDENWLSITYRRYPFPLLDQYFHRELTPIAESDSLGDSLGGEAARATRSAFITEIDQYQSQLQKSGSIVRGIEVGNNRDLALNSGLNLQLSGKITPNVDVVAALTDENTPLQPEGNTQTLREVDKVFVKITSPYVGGTLGDFNLLYGQSRFGNLQRKLEGITIENDIKSTHQQLTFGSSRGAFHSNRFLAQEGNQGPYQLTGVNGEREIIVLAGTERVFVDGVQQTRGENNDYIIDYSTGQITFSSNKLITSENRVEVDFEYTSPFQRYARNLLGFSTTNTQDRHTRFTYDMRFFREWDDTNNLLEDDAPLSDAEEAALEVAGDNRLAASIDGATADTAGAYIRQIDPISSDTFFVYVGPGEGDFSVIFTGVDPGQGDYRRVRLGVYEWVGPGLGEYLPINLVPLAGEKRFADIGLGLRITNSWQIKSEIAGSEFDQNIFSKVNDDDNVGAAVQVSSEFADTSLNIGQLSLGALTVNTRYIRQDSSFSPLDRPLTPEYGYKWNLGTDQLTVQENAFETDATYQPVKQLRLNGGFGNVDKGGLINSERVNGGIKLMRTVLPDADYQVERVRSETAITNSDWVRQDVIISRKLPWFTPRYAFHHEDRQSDNVTNEQRTGFRFAENEIAIGLQPLFNTRWQIGYQHRSDQLYNPNSLGQLLDQANSETYEASTTLEGDFPLRGSLSIALRDKNYTDFFEQLPADSMFVYAVDAQFQDTSWQDRRSHLANLELQYRNKSGSFNGRLDYRVASELDAIREKVYVDVGETQGNFRFDSTLNEYVPDPLGNFLLILLQTGQFESVTRLETGLQLNWRPVPSRRKIGGWRGFFNKVSSLTYAKVQENSKLEDILDIYLLNLSQFHQLGTSLRSAYNINQDFYYNERNPVWGILLRSRYRDNLSNQFIDSRDNETRIVWERMIEGRRRFFNRKLNLTLGYENTSNRRWATGSFISNQDIVAQAILSKINFRPSFRWQIELQAERGFENDRHGSSQLQINYWDLRPQVAYSLRGRARATANMTYIQVTEVANPFSKPIPFDMGRGKKIGNSWQWNMRFEYFLSNNVTINANYNGRRDAEAARTIHLGKAEVRAFF